MQSFKKGVVILLKVIEGVVVEEKLPKSGYLKDGSSIIGYDKLDIETLKEEGWLPLEDNPPEHNEETHYQFDDGYEVLENKVIKKYKVLEMPESKPSEIELLQEEMNSAILELTMLISMGGMM